VREHLAEILGSASFKTSGRSQQFLQYVVNESLAGRGESLKERVVGERVFGRDPAYDTGQDSIVRVKANEVRRRLAQYYEQHPHAPLRIEMLSGSYGITIRRLEVPARELTPEVRPKAKWWWFAGVAATIVLVIAWRNTAAPPTLFDAFWRPFLANSRPLLLCMPAPEAFRIYGKDRDGLIESFRPRPPGAPVQAAKVSTFDARIVPETGLLVGWGDARAMAQVQAFAATRQHQLQIRASSLTSFTDLSAGPSMVIGGETNHWSADLNKGSRFALSKSGGRNVIWDSYRNEAACSKAHPWEPPAMYDCALITRLSQPTTGHPVLLAAGLDHYGTYAVGDFVTNPGLLLPVLKTAPAGWESKNLQILFRVDRLRDGVGAPQLQAVHVW
jgi:hypothetical protein